MDQPTRVVSPQNRLRLLKTPSRQNLAEGDLLGDHAPQPAQLRVDLPAGFIHMRQHATFGGIPQACQVASALRDTRWIARQMPLRLIVNPKPCCRIAAASAWGNPWALFISTPRAMASGPTCTAAAPMASEVCSGC